MLEFPTAVDDGHGCLICPHDRDEMTAVSSTSLPLDRVSYWRIHCYEKASSPYPIIGVLGNETEKAATYMDPHFYGFRSDAMTWIGGKVSRHCVSWGGFKGGTTLVFRFDPISSSENHTLSVQIVNTDVESSIVMPPSNYRICLTLNEGTVVVPRKSYVTDKEYWELE